MKNIIIIDTSKCFECGAPKQDMHHVIPKSKGGTKTLPLCAKCHGLVHDRDFVKHRRLQKEGIARAKAAGKYTGRKVGSVLSDEKFLSRHKDIIKYLNDKNSVRAIVSKTGKSSATVMKVKKKLRDKSSI